MILTTVERAADEAVVVEEPGRRSAVGTSWYGVEMVLVAALVAVAVAAVVAAEHGDADEGC